MNGPGWWKPPERVDVKVVGPNNEYPGMVGVRCEVNPGPPDARWIEFFQNPQVMSGTSPSSIHFEGPRAGRHYIMFRCADEHLETSVENIDSRIKGANSKYEQEVVPEIETENQRQADARESERQRVADLQERADRL